MTVIKIKCCSKIRCVEYVYEGEIICTDTSFTEPTESFTLTIKPKENQFEKIVIKCTFNRRLGLYIVRIVCFTSKYGVKGITSLKLHAHVIKCDSIDIEIS